MKASHKIPRHFIVLLARALAIALVVLLGAPVDSEASQTWIVDAAGNGDATEVSGAVELASDGDVILIRPGTYVGDVSTAKELSFVGESGREVTVLDAGGDAGACIWSSGPSVRLSGLTLTGISSISGGSPGYMAISSFGELVVDDCAIVDNAGVGTAIEVWSGDATFTNTYFARNVGINPNDHPSGDEASLVFSGRTVFRNCVFDEESAAIRIEGSELLLEGCTFRGAGPYGYNTGIIFSLWDQNPTVTVRNCLFVDQSSRNLFGSSYYGDGDRMLVELVGNTFARCPDLFYEEPKVLPGSRFAQNVFTGSEIGLRVPEKGGVTVECNVAYGNEVNWMGFTPQADDGNVSVAPRYCDLGSDNFAVASNSPLLPQNNECGLLIGAFGSGCGPLSIENASWGQVKALYR